MRLTSEECQIRTWNVSEPRSQRIGVTLPPKWKESRHERASGFYPATPLIRPSLFRASDSGAAAQCATITIQPTPNLSCSMPKRGEKKVLASGIRT